jgi:flagellar hook-associated protein 3 FlgL
MYYDSIYSKSNTNTSQKLFDVNKQISSGLKIQYASDDVMAYTETMRLDNELASLSEVKKSTESGYKVSNQTDVVLNEFEAGLERFNTLMINAANGTNDDVSLNSIVSELEGISKSFKATANTSINGQYLFSGSSVDIRPISDTGEYLGNDKAMKAFLGSNNYQQYNISGADLFLGEQALVKRSITTNVVSENLTHKYPQLSSGGMDGKGSTLAATDTIRNLMGDTDNIVDAVNSKQFFYMRGTKHDGTTINTKVALKDTDTIQSLLDRIGQEYGNTPDNKVVTVGLNSSGQITIADKLAGSSKLSFHMVGAVDFSGGNAADVTQLDDLDVGENDFDAVINGTSTATNPDLYVKEFLKSNFTSASGAATNIEGIIYDRVQFEKSGALLTSNVVQVNSTDNSFATSSTKLSEVADLSISNAGTLDGTQLKLSGDDIYGTPYDVQIDLNSTLNGGSTFSLDGGATNYSIFNMDTPRGATNADDMTYQQLMDTINMVITNNIPASDTEAEYDKAIEASDLSGNTNLSYDGKLQFTQLNSSNTKATLALYDANSGDMSTGGSSISFNANNALTVTDPKTDFFKTIDEAIASVKNHKSYPDNKIGDVRNVGIENSIGQISALQDHIFQSHSLVGSQSNALTTSLERTSTLEISTMSLRSSVVDTDMAQAALTLQQLTTSYQAMLSVVGKVSKLSLINYV